MNWTSKEKQKFWNKAYQNYMNDTGLSAKQVSNFIKVNPFVALTIESQAIDYYKYYKFLKENKL